MRDSSGKKFSRWAAAITAAPAAIFLVLVIAFASQAQEPAAQPASTPESPPKAEYIGTETCAACHEEIAAGFPKNPHQAIAAFRGSRWKDQECEACPGPGSTHAETAEPQYILGFAGRASTNAINQACLTCHQGQDTQKGRLLGAHTRNSLNCVSCHSIHANQRRALLRQDTDRLCSGCHVAARAAFSRPFRHRLQEGAISCVDCHNPHGALPPASLQRFAGNEPNCFRCHADKRGPFPFEHAPVRLEPCSACHEPHGSANPRMLVRHTVRQLCLECHTPSPMRLGGGVPASHDLRSPRFQNCTVCHSRIHGSYVNRDFLR